VYILITYLCGHSTSLARTDPDLYDPHGRELVGDAVAVVTLPLSDHIGGTALLECAATVRRQMSSLLTPPDRQAIRWLSPDQYHVPIYFYKRSFQNEYTRNESIDSDISKDTQVFADIRSTIEQQNSFNIRFRFLVVHQTGAIELLAFPDDHESEEDRPRIAQLRDMFDGIADRQYARFAPRRPMDIGLTIGWIRQSLSEESKKALKQYLAAGGGLDNHSGLTSFDIRLEIDRLRIACIENGAFNPTIKDIKGHERLYLRQRAQWQLHIQEFHERERCRPAGCYGVMSPSKWLAHPEIVRCVKARDFRNIRPITAQIAPTLRCTNRCPICSYGQRKSGPFHDMTLEDMTGAVTALRGAGVKGVIFTGGGEPLCNDATIRGMRQARQVGLSVGLFTNGQLLSEDVCEELAREVEPSFVRVSINGWNAEAYSLVHGVRGTAYSLDRVLANLNSLARKKLEHKATFKLDIGILISPLVLDNLLDSAFEIKRLAFKFPGAINNVTTPVRL